LRLWTSMVKYVVARTFLQRSRAALRLSALVTGHVVKSITSC